MDKVDHKSKDILGGNVEKIAELFPGVVTEAQDEVTGELKKVIDFDLLRQHLSDELVEGDRERFRLDWPGKKASILKANTPTTKTLRPVREDSVDFDTTQNVFIEGDNFEVLKVLQESYLGKIKMIYIDPPYNTGKDFIYKDNFAADKGEYEEEIGVRDDENGGKLVKNTETNGRYHSDWLSMMQERLIVSRDLLADDGVIFISIGDDEQANLKKLCDEVFGEDNFLNTIVWYYQNSTMKNPTDKLAKTHEYILMYRRTEKFEPYKVRYGEVSKNLLKRFGKYADENMNIHLRKVRHEESYLSRMIPKFKNEFGREPEDNDIIDTLMPNYLRDVIEMPTVRTNDLKSQFDLDFDNPKNPKLIQLLIELASHKDEDVVNDDVILDFFSGSATTAHAVMQLNAKDGGRRKHIQVQLAEKTDEKSDAYKAGYTSISAISRRRIIEAAKKVRKDNVEQIAKRDVPLDTGFRAYRLSSSNFVDTAQHPAQTTQASLLDTADNIKDDRTPEDLLTEVILDLGLTLDLPIEHRDIAGHSVFFVGGNSMVACFDDKVSLDIVDGIAAEKPLRVVFKDSSFANDETRINIDIRLKQLSPDTTVQVV